MTTTFLEETLKKIFQSKTNQDLAMNIARSIIVIFLKLIFHEAAFESCDFVGCNFSNVKVIRALFQEVSFTDCKILGVGFDQINTIGLSLTFVNATLNLSSFYKLDLKNSKFTKSTFLEIDFT